VIASKFEYIIVFLLVIIVKRFMVIMSCMQGSAIPVLSLSLCLVLNFRTGQDRKNETCPNFCPRLEDRTGQGKKFSNLVPTPDCRS
jgi:hypothetical protein